MISDPRRITTAPPAPRWSASMTASRGGSAAVAGTAAAAAVEGAAQRNNKMETGKDERIPKNFDFFFSIFGYDNLRLSVYHLTSGRNTNVMS